MITVTDLRQKLDLCDIPDGTYEGTWGGYMVRFQIGGKSFEGRTSEGVRTPSCPCLITVAGNRISLATKDKS